MSTLNNESIYICVFFGCYLFCWCSFGRCFYKSETSETKHGLKRRCVFTYISEKRDVMIRDGDVRVCVWLCLSGMNVHEDRCFWVSPPSEPCDSMANPTRCGMCIILRAVNLFIGLMVSAYFSCVCVSQKKKINVFVGFSLEYGI